MKPKFRINKVETSLQKCDWIIWDPITKTVHFMREQKESPCYKELILMDSGDLELPPTVESEEEFDQLAREVAKHHEFYAAGVAYALVGRDDTTERRFQ